MASWCLHCHRKCYPFKRYKGEKYHFHCLEIVKRKELKMAAKAQTTVITRPIYAVAKDIKKEWGDKINFAAKPYVQAMLDLNTIDDQYGAEDAKSIILYFLSNASTFRGPRAKELKAELKAIAGVK